MERDEAARLAQAAGEGDALVLGVGLGELVTAALARPGPGGVAAWERDPWLLRLALSRHDWREALRSGRLRLLLGADLLEERGKGPRAVVAHPLLGQVYAVEREALASPAGRPVALLRDGGLFVGDLARALAHRGFTPFRLDFQRLSAEELGRSLDRLRPALVAAINYMPGLAEFCAARRTTLVCWEIDPSSAALAPAAGPTDGAFLFSFRRSGVEELRRAGFRNVAWLPLAADPERRRPVELGPDELGRYGAPVSIVGSSTVLEVPRHQRAFLDAWRAFRGGAEGSEAEGARALDEVLAEQARDDTSYRVPGLLAARWPGFVEVAGPDAVQAAGEVAAALKRLTVARRLAPFGVALWGDEGWRQAEGEGATYRGLAGHGRELGLVYQASRVNVDLGRIYQMDIVTMRVFDVLACGGFVLAERSRDLGELFEEGVEVEAWSTPQELRAKVSHYLANPVAARRLAARGREAVLARHTIGARVEHMLRVAGCLA